MSQVTVGVDIGLRGAIAVLNTVDPTNTVYRGVRVWDMPTKKIKKLCTNGKKRGKMKTATVYNIDRIRDIFADIAGLNLCDDVVIFIEEAQILPRGFTIKSNIGLARCQAIFEGVLTGLHIKYHIIPPKKWQGAMELTGKQKSGDANVQMAQQKHPTVIFKTAKGRVLDGRADALLLADYGYLYWRDDANLGGTN